MNKAIIEAALNEIGVSEKKGSRHEDRILEYFKGAGYSGIKDDETAWCAAFANFILKQCGIKGSGKLNARSFMNVGTPCAEPKMGDIVVFWRESRDSWKGHVGFYIREDEKYIYCLGGNQNNKVGIDRYPKYRLLSYRSV